MASTIRKALSIAEHIGNREWAHSECELHMGDKYSHYYITAIEVANATYICLAGYNKAVCAEQQIATHHVGSRCLFSTLFRPLFRLLSNTPVCTLLSNSVS